MDNEEKETRKINSKLTKLLVILLMPLLTVIWLGAFIFRYDICTAKVQKLISKEEQQKFFPVTPEDLESDQSLTNEDQITGFYRGILKCYRDAESRFYLWY